MQIGTIDPDESAAAFALRDEAFGDSMRRGTFDPEQPYVADDRRLVARDGGRVVGHLAMWPFAQVFGGREVPMAGVAGVAVSPEWRGRGVGGGLLAAALERMREAGDVIATLYPATVAPYAAYGWARAGHFITRSVATRALLGVPAPAVDVTIRPSTPDDLPALADLVRSVTATEPGGLVAPEAWYRRGLPVDPGADRLPGVMVAEVDGQVAGMCKWARHPGGPDEHGNRIDVPLLVGRDQDVERALWRHVGHWWSVAPTTTFVSWPTDPVVTDLPEADTTVTAELTWMTRLVDAAGAMAARGWPDGVRATVPLRIHDRRVLANDGPFVLEVGDGGAALTAGGDGRVGVDVADLARLWTGWMPATVLARRGALRGATTQDVAALAAVFDAPTPWLREYF